MKYKSLLGVFAPLVLSAFAVAQTTKATVQINGSNCQTSTSSAVLTGGVEASAALDLTYDQATHDLLVTVTNTSKDVANEANPLLTRLYLNMPRGAITGATLVSQSGPGQAQPKFKFTYGTLKSACFGNFDILLETQAGSKGGIANANASYLPHPHVIGPVSFTMNLSGPGASTINATAIAYSFSRNATLGNVVAAAKFQGGGASADESGFIGSTGNSRVRTSQDCLPSIWIVGEPKIGTTVQYCMSGSKGCHNCLWWSLTPGPVTYGPFTLSIGLPIIFVAKLGDFPTTNVMCTSLPIPNDPNLVGLTIYSAIATFPVANPTSVQTSSAYSFTITQ